MSTRESIENSIRALITGGILRNHEIAGRVGLYVLDLQALNLLALSEESMTPSMLSDAMRTPRSSVTRIVRRLEGAGFVTRHESTSDRRRLMIEVDRGRLAAIVSEYHAQSRQVERALAGRTPDELAIISEFFETLLTREQN